MRMHAFFAFGLLLGAGFAYSWQDRQAVILKKGEVLVVRSLDWVHTGRKGVRTGDAIRFELVEDITVAGTVALKRGTAVRGTVTLAKPARAFGRKGKLAFSIDEIQPENGDPIALKIVRSIQKGGGIGQSDAFEVQPQGRMVNADPVFLLRAGNDAYLDKGSLFEVEIADDTEILVR